jgi:hypothetical protein
VAFWLVLLAGLLALFVWWIWPRPVLPRLLVLTFDQVTTTEGEVVLRGQLWPEKDQTGVSLTGFELLFEKIGRPRAAGQSPWQAKAVTGPDGMAQTTAPVVADSAVTDFIVRFAGQGRGQGGDDRARLFVWPANTPLLLVSVESALTDAPPEAWQERAAPEIPRLPEAAKALEWVLAVPREFKNKVVYLALRADYPLGYRKVCDWIQRRPTAREMPFPDGPVLGRPSYVTGMTEADALRAILAELQSRFHGFLTGVTRNAQEAKAWSKAGLETILISKNGPDLAGIIRVSSWSEVPRLLIDAGGGW